jgi:hypothetical protein
MTSERCSQPIRYHPASKEMRTFAGATARDDELAVDAPHLMRRHALRGIHRRWNPVMRRDVRGAIWLRALVVIGADVGADTPLMGIDSRLGDGAAVQR